MPPKGAAEEDLVVKSNLKRKRSNPAEEANDSSEEESIVAIPPSIQCTNRWFLVIGHPHLGINLKKHQTYHEDDLRERCGMDETRLTRLEKALVNPKLFQEVVVPPEKDPMLQSKRTQPPSSGVSSSTASAATPTNVATPSEVGTETADGKAETKTSHSKAEQEQQTPEKLAEVQDNLIVAGDALEMESWFVLKGHPNLGLNLRLGSNYSEEELIRRCGGDEVLEEKLRAALSNPSLFQKTTEKEAKWKREPNRHRESNRQRVAFQNGGIVWFVGKNGPWVGLVASEGEKHYTCCPFIAGGDPDKAEEDLSIGPPELVPAKHVYPWRGGQGNAHNLAAAIFLADEYDKKVLACPKQVPKRRRLLFKQQPAEKALPSSK